MVLWAFHDESGEHEAGADLSRLTLGGFTAPWERVRTLCEEWRAALDEESLAEFHMKEIASDEDQFPIWPKERQDRLRRFVDILCKHAIEFRAFSYGSDRREGQFPEFYNLGIGRALLDLESVCRDSGERGYAVFAKTEEIKTSYIGGYFDHLDWSEYLNGYLVERSRDSPALQAAEIVARGMHRLLEDGTITYSFDRVLKAGKILNLWPPDPFATAASLGHVVKPFRGVP